MNIWEAKASAECVARCGHRALRSWDEGAEAALSVAVKGLPCWFFGGWSGRLGVVLALNKATQRQSSLGRPRGSRGPRGRSSKEEAAQYRRKRIPGSLTKH